MVPIQPRARMEYGALHVALDPAAPVPLYRQLYDGLRQSILDGRLRAGQRLPATRVLAAELGLSRNTVLLAFELLVSEGYLESRVGAGTFVRDDLPDRSPQVPDGVAAGAAGGEAGHALLSERGRAIAGVRISSRGRRSGNRPFQPGAPDLAAFPFDVWSRLAARCLRLLPRAAFGYGDPAGFGPLREAIAAYLRTARAVRCEAEQVIVVGGAQQGLDLAARVLLDEGAPAWVEDPGYQGTRAAFVSAGVRPVPVPVDAEGLQVDVGAARAPDARLAYVTPSYQFPLGVTMSLPRRFQLLDWAERAGAWILEDDYDSEYRYAGPPLASLQGLDAAGRVIYLGTFSKVLFPALRIGYLVVPPALVDAFVAAKGAADRQGSVLEQAVLADFIAEGHFSRHVRRMRVCYQARQERLVEALRRKLDGVVTVRPADAGMHLVGWLPEGLDDAAVAAEAGAYGLTVPPLSFYASERRCPPGLVLGYPAFDDAAIDAGVTRLARLLERFAG